MQAMNLIATVQPDGERESVTINAQYVSRCWKSLDQSMKDAWGQRAKWLNERPPEFVPFETVPNDLVVGLNDLVCESISLEWKYVKKGLKWGMTKVSRVELGVKYQMPSPILVRRQSFRRYSLSYLLRCLLIGKSEEKLLQAEVVKKTPKCVYVHFSSIRRFKAVFTLNGNSVGSWYCPVKAIEYYVAPKVVVRNTKGQMNYGFVLDETENTLKVLVNPNKIVSLGRPVYNKKSEKNDSRATEAESSSDSDNSIDHPEIREYTMSSNENQEYKIAEFHPIRVKFAKYSMHTMDIMFNRMGQREGEIVESCCS